MTVAELIQQAIDQVEAEHPQVAGSVIGRLRSALRSIDNGRPDTSPQGQANFAKQARAVPKLKTKEENGE